MSRPTWKHGNHIYHGRVIEVIERDWWYARVVVRGMEIECKNPARSQEEAERLLIEHLDFLYAGEFLQEDPGSLTYYPKGQ